MKIRNGFVSNSSSTSFLVATRKGIPFSDDEVAWGKEDFERLKEDGFYGVKHEGLYDECVEYKKKGFDIYHLYYNQYDGRHDDTYEEQDGKFIILLHEGA